MTDATSGKFGLLTDAERESLMDPDSPGPDRDTVVDQVETRFRATVHDIVFLFMVLRDAELRRLFATDNNPGITADIQHVLAFCYRGLQLADKDVEHWVSNAIVEAESTRQRDATVDLDIITEPFLPPAKRLELLEEGNTAHVSPAAVDQLFFETRVPPEELVAAFGATDDDTMQADDIEQARSEATHIERSLPPTITDIQVNPDDEIPDDVEGGNG